ncbi:hypothetical protein EmuJ_000408600 [Echinococcus multilocularis]|uniref:Uncharacterized protein n=1 Tax=Echinococcus multilocularis TaxID=6211 RepID=A0A068Y3W4_ECHMU|nr:hypothetical protein EmuJ_000408600 [Echinococcus multilocularis]
MVSLDVNKSLEPPPPAPIVRVMDSKEDPGREAGPPPATCTNTLTGSIMATTTNTKLDKMNTLGDIEPSTRRAV